MTGEPLLTEEEVAAIRLAGELANAVARIIPRKDAEPGAGDWSEAVAAIHTVQRMIAAQAAARAYPDRFRLLGYPLGLGHGVEHLAGRKVAP